MTAHPSIPLNQALSAQSPRSHSPQRFRVTGIQGVSRGLKTRLLELGLVEGTTLSAERIGSHLALKVRGDHLLVRVAEARMINVQLLEADP